LLVVKLGVTPSPVCASGSLFYLCFFSKAVSFPFSQSDPPPFPVARPPVFSSSFFREEPLDLTFFGAPLSDIRDKVGARQAVPNVE